MIENKKELDYLSLIKKAKQNIYNKLMAKQKFKDCCREFQFIRIFDTINFNNKMNSIGLTYLVLDEDYNFSEILESSIIDPIINRSNNIFGIIGKTGTGKSELAQTMLLIARQANAKYLNRDVKFYLCYTWEEFHSTLDKLKKGDIVWKDEMPRTIGKGSRIQKWEIENVLHSVRKMENTFIFIDPTGINVDLCDLYLESAGMNFKTKTNRFMVLNEQKQYFGHVYVKLHDNEQLRYWYETQKDIFIQEILEKAGRIKIEKDENNPENDNHSIEKFLRKNYISKNKERDIDIYLRYEKEKDKGLSFDTLAKIYKLSAGASVYYIYNRVKDFIEENFEVEI